MTRHYVYFAHPMETYGRKDERDALAVINQHFMSPNIVNPGAPEMRDAADVFCPLVGMDLFDLIASHAASVVAMPFRDGTFSAGVGSELRAAHRRGVTLLVVRPWLPRVRDRIGPLDFKEIAVCSIAETVRRFRG